MDDLGNEIEGLLSVCKRLKFFDFLKFYCWIEDIFLVLWVGVFIVVNL